MGACGSTEAAGADQPSMEEVSRSKAIDRLLREEEQRQAREVKVSGRDCLHRYASVVDDSLNRCCCSVRQRFPAAHFALPPD